MDILIQLKISQELHERAREILARVERAHADEVEVLEGQITNCTDERKLVRLRGEWEALHERGRRLTLHNVVRVAIEDGLETKNYQGVLKRIAVDGIPLGRPRRVAS